MTRRIQQRVGQAKLALKSGAEVSTQRLEHGGFGILTLSFARGEASLNRGDVRTPQGGKTTTTFLRTQKNSVWALGPS